MGQVKEPKDWFEGNIIGVAALVLEKIAHCLIDYNLPGNPLRLN